MSVYEAYGALGSPYSLKVRAALRAKGLPYRWTGMTSEERARIMPNVKAPVIPVIRTPEGAWKNDSTPFLISLEDHGRRLLPEDPALRFACLLLEDMADEWFMKAMFHYRWTYAEDTQWCASWLMYDALPNAGEEAISTAAESIRERQISRMPMVGCTPQTAPIIEASWKRSCAALQDMALGATRFLFGDRISLADLAFYGQLKVMSYDATPMAWLRQEAPYLYRWIDHADDAGGIEGAWADREQVLSSPALRALLAQAGDTYLPFLAANADALASGHETFSLLLEGRPYTQAVFKYQAKCLASLQEEWQRLDEPSRSMLAPLIGTGVSSLV